MIVMAHNRVYDPCTMLEGLGGARLISANYFHIINQKQGLGGGDVEMAMAM